VVLLSVSEKQYSCRLKTADTHITPPSHKLENTITPGREFPCRTLPEKLFNQKRKKRGGEKEDQKALPKTLPDRAGRILAKLGEREKKSMWGE